MTAYTDARFSNEDLASLLMCNIIGDLELCTFEAGVRHDLGGFRRLGAVPDKARFLSLRSTKGENAGFVVLCRAPARTICLPCDPSFEIDAVDGQKALVFATTPNVDIIDIAHFFVRTCEFDKDNYRLSLDLPLLGRNWHLRDETIVRLLSTGCPLYALGDPAKELSIVLH